MTALVIIWVGVNLMTLVLTVAALIDAKADRDAVRALNGAARELASDSVVRREWLRVGVQTFLLGVALPSLIFPDVLTRPIELRTVSIGLLACVPVVLLYASLRDAQDRRKMTLLIASELGLANYAEATSLRALLGELASQLNENTRISQEASDHADAAYKEANSVNEKIASQGQVLIQQGEAIAAQGASAEATGARVEGTIDETAAEVHDIHDATVKNGGPA